MESTTFSVSVDGSKALTVCVDFGGFAPEVIYRSLMFREVDLF